MTDQKKNAKIGDEPPALAPWRERLHEIIFGHETRAGRAFDVVLLIVIALSVLAVMLESVPEIEAEYGFALNVFEWIFTILFTIEYLLRILIVRHPRKYIFSFFGIIDLLACLPTYLSLFVTHSEYLLVIRILRMLRVFRILKMARHLREGSVILNALRASRPKITVFLFAILSLTIIMGTIMYLIEGAQGEASQFENLPQSVYWAIVTITTVGYGDITPTTIAGQMLAAVMMIMGYAIIAVPTGMVTVELFREFKEDLNISGRSCPECLVEGHRLDSKYCYFCGALLEPPKEIPTNDHPPPGEESAPM